MQYIIITLLSIISSAFLIYLLANKLLNIRLKIKPLILCACCALLINIILPRIIIGFFGVVETIGILAIFTIIFAYCIAHYYENFSKQRDHSDTLNQTPLVVQASIKLGELSNCSEENEKVPEDAHQVKESESLVNGLLREKPEIIMAAAIQVSVATSLFDYNAVDKIHIESEPEEQELVAILEDNTKDVTVSLKDELSSIDVTLSKVDIVDKINTISTSEDQEQVTILEDNTEDVAVSLEDELSFIDITLSEVDILDEIDTISESEEQIVISEEYSKDVTTESLENGLSSNDSAIDEFVMVDKIEEVVEYEQATKAEAFFEDAELPSTTIFDKNNIVGKIKDSSEPEDDNGKINCDNQIDIEELDAIDNVDQIDEAFELEKEVQTLEIEENNEMVQTEDESQLPINIFDSTSNDLDGLMDFAFMYKEQRNFIQALRVFRQALILYPSSEAAPFLVMEIGTILKNNGQYDEAINVFCEAKKLPGVQKNNMFELEFIKTIAYLRIVKNILLQHHLGFISFNNIPEHVLKEIDTEFREWRSPV